jgi:hypothetical protein
MKSDKRFVEELMNKPYYGKLYQFAMECREKAFQVVGNKKFLQYWDGNVYGGKICLRESFHAGIDTGRFLDCNIEEFISEVGKRIFRKRFPEELKGFATKVWYSLD